ncbi:hypothetical protein IEQ34_010803 [Dendrobium chrysotoxum]|uniref:Virilizer N-terminal domain-containing protein n=1 Tax=Dendrobium chrysotoxum TaxID=161865 RepID=A0AAV7GEE6_DENCH|nr:hypothetical protein IEQ34_010803 [Dendrobium chrysotoxum]
MGRPEPYILFAQTFTHPLLDEYVDEVLFAEPIVISSCEFLELNSPLSTPPFSLMGATSPPSFAMELFVHCEGESRFRRLCQPFLYSHSSSNILEVEAIVTSHLVVRGCYRSITLVVYGNTAEDLGQFNIDFDLDNSLASLVSSPSDGKLEDLPPALFSDKWTIEELVSSTLSLSLPFSDLDISSEMRQFLHLALKICQLSDDEAIILKIVRTIITTLQSHVNNNYCGIVACGNELRLRDATYVREDLHKVLSVISEATNELLEVYQFLQSSARNENLLQDTVDVSCSDSVTSQLLVDMLYQQFPFLQNFLSLDIPHIYQNKKSTLGLSMVLLVCSASESCYHFVNGGGIERIVTLLGDEMQCSTAFTLLLLGVIENVTRHAVGCEAFLGWWPRNGDNVPATKSEGYCNLLKLLLRKQRHDVAYLASYVLHRLRIYELASRYEFLVLSIVENHSLDCPSRADTVNSLMSASSQIKQILKLLNLCGPFEDPSPAGIARRSLGTGKPDGPLSYKATSGYIAFSKYSFLTWDIDVHLLSLLKERGFFPLSAALLSFPSLHAATGIVAEIFMEIAVLFQSLLLALLFCRSGLTFLLLQPEITSTVVLSLQCFENNNKSECSTLRQAAFQMSKGFFCHPQEIAMIMEIHLRVGKSIDRLLATNPCSDEFLWVLWDLCAISRSECGRQAILSLGYFPEAISVLLDAFHSFKDPESISGSNGTSQLGLATFHSAAEIFEILVSDSTSSALRTWIGQAMELHKALHLSSPGSHRKDAPARLLEWIDAGVVYQKNGAIGLLRYAAFLASGGDAHLSSTTVLVSDSIDVENVVGDTSDASDSQVLDILLGKLVNDKFFDGITLRNTSIVQLTTAIRILSFISENSDVAAALFEEGAVTLLYVVLANCKCMVENSSNTYDYLVDGAECNSTSELLLERSYEQSLVDLMIPSLISLINILKKLRETKEQYRNKKLLNVLLRLHHELAAYASNFSSHFPRLGLGFGAVCHLVASVLAFWPVFGWIPGLFHCLLESMQATSSLPLGPKDACSMICLLSDLVPEEGIWLWNYGIPSLSAVTTLTIETVLGPEVEKDIHWYLQPEHLAVLLVRLTPLLDRIAQIVLHFSFTTLVVIKDMLRVFIVRIACQRPECADVLLRPLISWIDQTTSEATLSDADLFKMYGSLNFIASLLEHPRAKILLLKASSIRVLVNALKRCGDECIVDGNFYLDNKLAKNATFFSCWCMPLLKSLALLFDSRKSTQLDKMHNPCLMEDIGVEDGCLIGQQLIRLCQVLPVGRELLGCMAVFKEFISSEVGRRALESIFCQFEASLNDERKEDEKDAEDCASDKADWRFPPPFLHCWKKLLSCLDAEDDALNLAIETAFAGVSMLRCLFGLPDALHGAAMSTDEKLQDVLKLKISKENFTFSAMNLDLHKVRELVKSMRLLLEIPFVSPVKPEDISCEGSHSLSDGNSPYNIKTLSISLSDMIANVDEAAFSEIWNFNWNKEGENELFALGCLSEKFMWECPDSSSERIPSSSGKRKIVSTEMSAKRSRDSLAPEAPGSNAFSRAVTTPANPSGPSRRDTFRQRKPNTSRPPSMHVDDYVARERNIDGLNSSSHVGSSQRAGSSGRPPSIHVDEFIARQRERQSPVFVTVGETTLVRQTTHENQNDNSKLDKSQQLKADFDDDLQGIDIVFDEESGSEDRLPFPQLDENLQSTPLIVGESSPGSVVEETEGDVNDGTQLSHVGSSLPSEDIESRSETSLKRSMPTEIPVAPDVRVSSDRTVALTTADTRSFPQNSDESKNVSHPMGSRGFDILPNATTSGPSSLLNSSSTTTFQPLRGPSFLQRDSSQKATMGSLPSGSFGYYEHKLPINQPPLPPMPHPTVSTMSTPGIELVQGLSSHYIPNVREMQPPFISGYPVQTFNVNGSTNLHGQSENASSVSSLVSLTAQPLADNKLLWNSDSPSSSNTSARPTPPLPPTPPPFSTPLAQSTSNFSSQTSLYLQSTNAGQVPQLSTPITDLGIFSASGAGLSYSLSPLAPAMLNNRPAAAGTFFGSPPQPHGQNPTSISQPGVPNPPLSLQSIPVQPPPPPPPQPRAPHPSQNLGLPIQVPQPQFDQVMSLPQGTIQVQMQPVHIQQQLPQLQIFYPSPQQDHIPHPVQIPLAAQLRNSIQEAENIAQQQKDSGMTLQQYFSSPEAIQSLLSDRDKLCQLLEQHPKLMQMLQVYVSRLLDDPFFSGLFFV